MKHLLKYTTAFGLLLMTHQVFAQDGAMTQDRATTEPLQKEYVNPDWLPSLVPDGTIDRVKDRSVKVLNWPDIRENDIAFKRRFWKRIDIHEKQNMPFIYPGDEYSGGGAFIEILIDGIKRGKIRAFQDDRFTTVLSYDDVKSKLNTESSAEVIDIITGESRIETVQNTFNPDDVAMYQVQEDWIFDRNAGRMIPRLRGITANIMQKDDEGNFRNWVPLFTIYYPEARPVLAQYEVYNPQNDVHRISWTDYLDRMMYSGYIVKSSLNNPTGEMNQAGFDGLIKGKNEFQDLIQKEMDMWEL
ncbi:MAG TPA: gliding motility protein GldN [Edaphocola sp.]|nr:gliding motility protein GldN [Edaphocola sp.]